MAHQQIPEAVLQEQRIKGLEVLEKLKNLDRDFKHHCWHAHALAPEHGQKRSIAYEMYLHEDVVRVRRQIQKEIVGYYHQLHTALDARLYGPPEQRSSFADLPFPRLREKELQEIRAEFPLSGMCGAMDTLDQETESELKTLMAAGEREEWLSKLIAEFRDELLLAMGNADREACRIERDFYRFRNRSFATDGLQQDIRSSFRQAHRQQSLLQLDIRAGNAELELVGTYTEAGPRFNEELAKRGFTKPQKLSRYCFPSAPPPITEVVFTILPLEELRTMIQLELIRLKATQESKVGQLESNGSRRRRD